MKPIVYFAGKISPTDWRTQILGSRAGASSNDWDDNYGFKRLLNDEAMTIDCGSFLYGGPFFISCDHGCAHGLGTHGAAPDGCLYGSSNGQLEVRQGIWLINQKRIERADYVFCYINETNCFGTLIELGYASAKFKTICVAFGPKVSIREHEDLWMAQQCGFLAPVLYGEPQETFKEFSERWIRGNQ